MGLRNKFANFMYGRYGVDQLSKFMLSFTLVLCIVNIFLPQAISGWINILVLFNIFYIYFRMFSRNIYKRSSENQKYLDLTRGWRKKIHTEKKIAGERKYYKFFKCPGCGRKVRVPKGHGKIQIRCPKCNETFIRKS